MATKFADRVEGAIPISEASEHIPGRPHRATVHRWCMAGVRGHKLSTFLAGGRRMVMLTEIEDFLRRINDDDANNSGAVQDDDDGPSDKDTSRRGKQAGRVLEKLGA